MNNKEHLTDTKKQFANKVIIVTGSTQGSGAETAILFAARGAKAITICGRQENKGQQIKKEIELCQAEYNPEKYPDVTKEKFNTFCICLINGLVEIYDNEEAKYQAKFNKPSDDFTNKEEEIIKYCASKI